MKSMTGYGRGIAQDEKGNRIQIEISSVNGKKQADIRMSLPRELSCLDNSLRQQIQDSLVRGSIQVTVSFKLASAENLNGAVDLDAVEYWCRTLKEIASKNGLAEPSLQEVMSMPGVISDNHEQNIDELLSGLSEKAMGMALKELEEARIREGLALKEDLMSRGQQVQSWLNEIDGRQDEAILAQKQRLRERIAAMDPEIKMDEERLSRELVYYVDRADITEEVVRLKTHLVHYFELLNSDEAIGRNLDFLGQEMNREITTLSSKTADLPIAENALQMKIEISKIREQVMNIE